MAAPRPWSAIPIHDDGEPLVELPPALLRLEPHPYASLGAPYGEGASPFRLRLGVIRRLLAAQEALQCLEEGWRLAIFDAWRPVAVQRFMVAHSIEAECRARGFDRAGASPSALRQVEESVARFWAPPSTDPATPPPHSTGGAVDLTLADADGRPLAMGGEIDAIGPVSEPDHYAAVAAADPGSEAALWQRRRDRLASVMAGAGFARHPNEWWHFSHGDQLWAWSCGEPAARYGRTGEPEG
ncbi:M15 family metallopeptidase [Cyanobium sp. FGCU-52]|nr:M15 family metallopeptidase [Cyanobium sp. FGCU52]